MTPNIRFLFPSGKYSNFGCNKYETLSVVKIIDPYMPNNPNADNQKVPTHLVYKK